MLFNFVTCGKMKNNLWLLCLFALCREGSWIDNFVGLLSCWVNWRVFQVGCAWTFFAFNAVHSLRISRLNADIPCLTWTLFEMRVLICWHFLIFGVLFTIVIRLCGFCPIATSDVWNGQDLNYWAEPASWRTYFWRKVPSGSRDKQAIIIHVLSLSVSSTS